MNINQMLQQTGAVDAIARELGVDPATAEAGATACCRPFCPASKTRSPP